MTLQRELSYPEKLEEDDILLALMLEGKHLFMQK
jgi:hypothetical protein